MPYDMGTGGEALHNPRARPMLIRTTSQLAKNAPWAVFNVQTGETVELHLSRKAAQAACDEMHSYAGVTNWMRVGRNPSFEVSLPAGTDLMALAS